LARRRQLGAETAARRGDGSSNAINAVLGRHVERLIDHLNAAAGRAG
jgi:hypothetical protein